VSTVLDTGTSLTSHEANAFIDAHVSQRQVNRVLHGFPSPRFWQIGVPLHDVMARRGRTEAGGSHSLSLYIGVPYCIRTEPDRCGYCLFPVEVFAGTSQLDIYLDYLAREGEMFRDFFAGETPQTVYIGGGTPNLMKPVQYTRMMDIVRTVFPGLSRQAPVTMEGIPQLFTREKLEHMRVGGISRVSIGVQQLDQELNRLSGRRQTARHVFDAIQWAHELGMQCNVDLIFGWPRQTMKTLMTDLAQVVATGVDHIAHYELNIGGATDFSLHRRDELPSPELTREMYTAARDFLLENGYRQLTVYDFQKQSGEPNFVYEECKRDFEPTECWGWGFAGVSEFSNAQAHAGWAYVNHRRARNYFSAIAQGDFPIERGYFRCAADVRLNDLFRNLQGMRVDRHSCMRRFGVDVYEEFEPVWQALVDRGWCTTTADAIELTKLGTYYVPLIQALISEQRLRELRVSASSVRIAI